MWLKNILKSQLPCFDVFKINSIFTLLVLNEQTTLLLKKIKNLITQPQNL